MRIVSWNIHGCVGRDGKHSPERTAQVLLDMKPDLIALQEVSGSHAPEDSEGDLHYMARRLGFVAAAGPARRVGLGYFGNAVLSRYPILDARVEDISVPGREPRAVLAVEVSGPQGPLQVLVTHFGLSARERLQQARTLAAIARRGPDRPFVIAGDFNEWRLRAHTLALLNAAFGHSPAPRSFPAHIPLLRLDRIWVNPRAALISLSAFTSARARIASDHLPVLATAAWSTPG